MAHYFHHGSSAENFPQALCDVWNNYCVQWILNLLGQWTVRKQTVLELFDTILKLKRNKNQPVQGGQLLQWGRDHEHLLPYFLYYLKDLRWIKLTRGQYRGSEMHSNWLEENHSKQTKAEERETLNDPKKHQTELKHL